MGGETDVRMGVDVRMFFFLSSHWDDDDVLVLRFSLCKLYFAFAMFFDIAMMAG